MGIPVVISDNGIPVRPVDDGWPVMTVADNGLGAPITISDDGAPFVVQGLVPPGPPNLVVNGTFDTDTVWTKGAGWSISGGVGAKASGTLSSLSQPISSPAGRYRIVYDVVTRTSGGIVFRVNNIQTPNRTSPGHYDDEVTIPAAVTELAAQGNSSFSGSIDNVELYYLGP